jgi:hypothetical protein
LKFLAAAFSGLVFILQAASATAADQRPALRGVSAIRIANYGSPSVLLEGRDKLSPIVGELNALRSKPWRSGDTKLACYSTMVLYSGKQTLATFRVTPENIVEREGAKGQPIYSLAIDASDTPALSRLLTEIAPAKDC